MNKFQIKSFGKINLYLKVIKKLKNGYHSIKSLITFCNLYDNIYVQEIFGSKDEVNFFGKFKNQINNKSNTLTQVLFILRKRNFLKNRYFKIDIQKNIPHGSGLGGGSSNAASLLYALNRKIKLNLKKKQINEIAKQIGFDVPIVLEKKNTLLIGKNNKIFRLNKKFMLNILIVYPNIICETKKIYKINKKFTFPKSKSLVYTQDKRQLINYLINENNDLEEAVIKCYPKIGKLINLLKNQKGCYFSRITGSGSACFGIFSNTKKAFYAQKLIKLKYPKYWSFVSKTI